MSTLPRYRKLSRRDLLKVSFTAGGALLISACTPELLPAPTGTPVPSPIPTSTSTPEPVFESDLFIRIEQNGKISLRIHRSEMGQGVRTSLAMILAEELEADWKDVHVEQMHAVASLNQVTSGSGSVTISYTPLQIGRA